MTDYARILVFTGDGKGKTTASMGMVLRAIGHDMNIMIIQFVKHASTGEMDALKRFDNVEFVQAGLGFLPDSASGEFAEHIEAASKGIAIAFEALTSDKYQLIILDEICFALSHGLLKTADVVDVVTKASHDKCIVLTGRNASEKIIDLADTVSEIKCIKHGFNNGIPAQEGVEF